MKLEYTVFSFDTFQGRDDEAQGREAFRLPRNNYR